MLTLSRKLIQLRKFAASVLLALVVYQLGACPCGCVEHNAWLQMFGVSSHSHEDVALGSGNAPAISGDHDCSGEYVVAYMDNARPLVVNECMSQVSLAHLKVSEAAFGATSREKSAFSSADCLVVAHALPRPALQVYRL
ncbi:MAG: hypothetical protein AB8B50_16725 [Pirellulaceae bacterium]